jgi:hypothetical protein
MRGALTMGPKYHLLGAFVIAFANALWLTGPSAVACPTGTVTADYEGTGSGTGVYCTQDGGVNIVIQSEPLTTIYNLVDNSINGLQITRIAGTTTLTFIVSTPTTSINNFIDNSINVQVYSELSVPINIFIESNPTTIIYNLVDNSVNVLANDSAAMGISNLLESGPTTAIYNLIDNSIDVITDNAQDGLAAVPEAGSLTLLGAALGAFGLVGMRRRTC